MNPLHESQLQMTRRQFFGRSATGIGIAALAHLLPKAFGAPAFAPAGPGSPALPGLPHFAPKAKRVILLWQGGGPSQVDLFDHKPGLEALRLQELPESVRSAARLSTMTASQKKFPILPAIKPFRPFGKSGRWLSEMIPHTGGIVDDICLIHSMHTEAVNHAPGVTFCLTGSQIPGRPSMGAWLTYGLGSTAENLPAFVVLTSADQHKTCGQLFYEHYWGSGFIPSKFQGVRLRGEGGDPVLYLSDPPGLDRAQKRALLDDIAALNQREFAREHDPEIETRIAQYEMAFKMQASVPSLADIKSEPAHVLERYGPDVQRPGSYARNCLLARRLAERGVRFIQLMHSGWDQHNNLPTQLEVQCRDTDQPSAALVRDLKERGMLDETLVIFAGEFGRTVFVQGDAAKPAHGRDHLGTAFSIWMAGGGVKPGIAYGESDEFSYRVAKDPVHVHDWQATVLHLLGIDHERLTYRYQGRQFRLTDVHGKVVRGVLA